MFNIAVFRSFKSELGLRPVFHHKEIRVDGHLFITVLAGLPIRANHSQAIARTRHPRSLEQSAGDPVRAAARHSVLPTC